MTGMKTLSWKLPCDAAIPTAMSLAMTCTATIVSASHWVGFTLPGMIELPGSLAGIVISPSPQRGPEASQRMSLAIFMRSAASALSPPCAKTSASFEVRAWNLLGALIKVVQVSRLISSAQISAKPAGH